MSIIEENFVLSSETSDNDSDWWNTFVNEQYPNEKCIKHLKCSRKTYMVLIKALKPHIAPRIGAMLDENSSLYFRKG